MQGDTEAETATETRDRKRFSGTQRDEVQGFLQSRLTCQDEHGGRRLAGMYISLCNVCASVFVSKTFSQQPRSLCSQSSRRSYRSKNSPLPAR